MCKIILLPYHELSIVLSEHDALGLKIWIFFAYTFHIYGIAMHIFGDVEGGGGVGG